MGVSIRAPVRGATCRSSRKRRSDSRRFNPRPRAGGDLGRSRCPEMRREVSIRAPVRGATYLRQCRDRDGLFQSAPPCGGRPARAASAAGATDLRFNPRPRAGGDLRIRDGAASLDRQFQSAPPCGGRLARRTSKSTTFVFQSAPPCGGRPHRVRAGLAGDPVSIRAPVRGATGGELALIDGRGHVSIRAPVRGATRSCRPAHARLRFNPRPRAGGDHCSGASTTRSRRCFNPRPRAGGDSGRGRSRRSMRRFNPRPRAGGDLRLQAGAAPPEEFQSAPPCGGRPASAPRNPRSKGFNPRPRAGGDLLAAHARGEGEVSIRAPVRGATGGDTDMIGGRRCFNPRPRAGGDRASS